MKLAHLALAIFVAALPIAAQASAPEAVLRLEQYRRSVAVRVEANGQAGLFTLDTAGGLTIVSPDFARATGCRPWGQLVGYQMTGNRLATERCDDFAFSAGGHPLTVPVAGVLDVAPLVAADAAPVQGSLALDAFAGRTITIDFAGLQLIVETPESAAERVEGARELPLYLSREVGGIALAPLVGIPTPNGTLRFELDSGNGGTILVSRPYAASFGLDPDAEGPQPGRLTVADGIVAQGMMFTPDLTIDGNLGMPFLKDWVVTLDLAAGRMWVRRSAVPPPAGMGAPPPPRP